MRLCLFALSLLVAASAAAQEPGPEELVRRITGDVLEAIKVDPQLQAGDRKKALALAEEKVLPVRIPAGATDAVVRNQYLRPGRPPVVVEYAMHKTPAGWKIYDITVEGVSLVLTYRAEFDQVTRASGIDGLIKRLAEKNA